MELCNIGDFPDYDEDTTIALVDSVFRPPEDFTKFNEAGETFSFEGDESDDWTRVHGCDVLSVLTDVASNPSYNFYRVLDEYGEYDDRSLVSAIVYAADHGADVVNLSVGSDHISNDEKDCGAHGSQCAVDEAAEYAREKGVVLVSAAGNAGEESDIGNVCCPALSEHSIAVGGCVARCTAEEDHPPGAIWVERADGVNLSGTFCSMKGCDSSQDCQGNRSVEEWEGNPQFLSRTPDTLAPVYYPRMMGNGEITLGYGSSFATPIVSATIINIIEGLKANDEEISPSRVRELIRVTGESLESVPVGVFDGSALVNEIFDEKGLGRVDRQEDSFDSTSRI